MSRTDAMFLALLHVHEWMLMADFYARLRAAMTASGLG